MTNVYTKGFVLVAQGDGAVPVYTAPKAFLWTLITILTYSLVVQNAYIVDAPGISTLTLPLNSNLGDTIKAVYTARNP